MDAQQAAAVSALGAAYAARQRALVASFVAELVSLIRQVFRPDDPAGSWDATQLAVSALVQRYHRTSATMGARYYLDARRASGVAGARRAGPLPRIEDMTDGQVWDELGRIAGVGLEDLDEERIDATVRATGIASYQRSIRAGRSPQRAADTMTTTLAGATQELAVEGGRRVVHDAAADDEEAVGWARIARPGACWWCAMLASRGAVYRSAATAGRRVNKRFVGDGMFKFHNHCQCVARPIFDADDPAVRAADDLYEQWRRVTAGRSGRAAMRAWAEYWGTVDDRTLAG